MNPLFWYGKKHDIEEKDLYNVLPDNRSEPLGDRLERFWKKEVEQSYKNKNKPSLINAIKKCFGRDYIFYAVHVLFLSLIIR